jgi:hypothetical protein
MRNALLKGRLLKNKRAFTHASVVTLFAVVIGV